MTPGDVMLIDFPFSDLSGSKVRPAVVLNVVQFGDAVICQVTSNAATGAIGVKNTDLLHGKFTLTSYIRPERLFTADKKLIRHKIGRLTPAKLETVRDAVADVVRGK